MKTGISGHRLLTIRHAGTSARRVQNCDLIFDFVIIETGRGVRPVWGSGRGVGWKRGPVGLEEGSDQDKVLIRWMKGADKGCFLGIRSIFWG
ncbi:MAG TPA: hypothetical protein PK213_12540 [Deltaproteobacteria bacterium]|nr:hypothetical protein [Deltaproteobacteria bacterium]